MEPEEVLLEKVAEMTPSPIVEIVRVLLEGHLKMRMELKEIHAAAEKLQATLEAMKQ